MLLTSPMNSPTMSPANALAFMLANKKPQPKLGLNLPCLMIEPRAVAIRLILEKIRLFWHSCAGSF